MVKVIEGIKEKPFSVDFWGSHPDEDNDDCYYGEEFDSAEEAIAEYLKPCKDSSIAFIEIDGLTDEELAARDMIRVRKNPDYKPSKRINQCDSEFAMQAGMMGGCDAYNEAMGYESSEYDDDNEF